MMRLVFSKSGEEGCSLCLFSGRITRQKLQKASEWGKLIGRKEYVDNTPSATGND
jgi:hypothetical protein